MATTIPAGTRATPDGEIVFATLEDLTIPAGQRTGSVEAECQIEGENGNGFVPGQINQPIDVFPYYESVENITESAGGADRESDAAFYERMRESVETYSTAGPLGGYEYFAKSASALIADVKATSPEPGEVCLCPEWEKGRCRRSEERRDRSYRNRLYQGQHGRNQGGAKGTAQDER